MRPKNVHPKISESNAARSDAGFTLVELLVVIAISALLFGLLLKPLVDSLSLTQQAQATAAAQDSARKTMEVITRELGAAASVSDNSSHPFVADSANASSAVSGTNVPFDRFSNFLNLEIPKSDGTTVVGHAYNAKIDLVLPRRQTGKFVDPTTSDEDARLDSTSGSTVVKSTDLLLPIAPGTTFVRYFVGLKNPEMHYRNVHENSGVTTGDDNTYVLYRAQFAAVKTNGVANSDLFAANATTQGPEIDDPDFFRTVTATDINWLDAAHAPYGNLATAHNIRLHNWEKIAQRVIGAPQVDLLLLPHNSDGTIGYDGATGTFPGVAHYGMVQDPVTGGNSWPVVNTSVTFKPTITNDATPATSTDYIAAGIPANAVDSNGLPFIPSIYRTDGQAWNDPYTIDLYPASSSPNAAPSAASYRIEKSPVDNATLGIAAGDLVEYALGGTPTPVYNVTYGAPVKGAPNRNYVPVVVNPDSGVISFAVNALPNPDVYTGTDLQIRTNRANTIWTATVTGGVVNLSSLPKSPLPNDPVTPTGTDYVKNAIIVPGSVRVYGPKIEAGLPGASGTPEQILYTAVGQNQAPQTGEYQVDYDTGVIHFSSDVENSNVDITWQYQSNLTVADPTKVRDQTNPAAPMSVRVDYQSRDMIGVTIGVRIYATSGKLAQIVSASSNVKVGNSNR